MAIRDFAKFIRGDILALGPGLAAGAYFFGAEGATVAAGIGLPLVYLSALGRAQPAVAPETAISARRRHPRDAVGAALDGMIGKGAAGRDAAACYAIGLDDPNTLLAGYGKPGLERVMVVTEDRLLSVLRDGDMLRTLEGGRFAIALSARRRIDLETAIQIAGRMQRAISEPVSVDGATVSFSASIGFCLPSRVPEPSGAALLAAAELAQGEAWMNGPGAIRAYSADIQQRTDQAEGLRHQIEAAIENGEIVAFFQPQISTDTGAVTGFEALARWMHPLRGILPPAEFLPAVRAAGLSGRLSETILAQALAALRNWDRAALGVATVSVNFASDDLRDPNLVARLKWELDRFDLPPERLVIEVLESVVADTDHDIIVRNLTALARLGCGIDLDDFGTGQAPITALRRFSVTRIKIDRSFIAGVDTMPDQQRIVAAILSMAEQLGLKTLAEGVETVSEHALLSQLGCSHVQGFAIARPMPVQSTPDWLAAHRRKLARTPGLAGRKAV